MEEGSWVVPETGGMTISEVVGKPGSPIGEAELMNGTWSGLFKGKLYFNPYEYQKAIQDNYNPADDGSNAEIHQ